MTSPHVHRIKRRLEEAVDRIDREHITHWLMMFAAKKPINLHHPRIGKIGIGGTTFGGSVVDVYDRYVLLVIDDLIAETTQIIEDMLEGLPRQDRDAAVSETLNAIEFAKARLLSRAREIKGVLLAPTGSRGSPARIAEQINWTPYRERLTHCLRTLRIQSMNKQKVTQGWFRRYRTALDRMRAAEPNVFALRAGRLAAVFSEPEFADVRSVLTEMIDLNVWLARARSEDVEFGEPFPFPDDPIREIGTAILLLEHLASDNAGAEAIAVSHYSDPHDARIVTPWRNMVDAIYVPLEGELRNYLESQGWLESDANSSQGFNSITVRDASGVVIQQGVVNGNQSANISISTSEIEPALAAFGEMVRPLLAESERRDFDADISTIKNQMTKSNPSTVIIRECGVTLRALTEGVVAGAATPSIVAAASALWTALGIS